MDQPRYRWISARVRPKEDYRFVTGRGHFAADVRLPRMTQVATVPSAHAHARIVSIDLTEALAVPGVVGIVTGEDLRRDVEPMPQYAAVTGVNWYSLAVGKARFAGEWVAAIVAENRYIAEDAADRVRVVYEPLPAVLDAEQALDAGAPVVHEDWGSNVLWQRRFTWGPVDDDFSAADVVVSARYRWNRHAGVPIETTAVVAEWDEGRRLQNIWAAISMPQFADILSRCLRLPLNQVRIHQDVDVGGSYGVKRGIKHAVLAAYLARRFRRPVQFIEDRLDNMRAGDAHGPDRVFYVSLAASRDGTLRALKIKTIDDEGAYPGRSPAQIGKPIGAIVGPYRIGSVEYEGIAVTTNKTSQIAYRGFGQSPTNYVIERIVDKMAYALGMDRVALRTKNVIQPDQFPYRIPSGTYYDSGDYPAVLAKALETARWDELVQERDRLRQEGRLAGIGVACCIEPGGGNALFLPLLNPKNEVTTFPEGCYVNIDRQGKVTAAIGFPSAGQGHETLVSQILAEEFNISPDEVTVVHADSLTGLPTQSPVASRMAIMLGGAVHGAAMNLKRKLIAIAAHQLREAPERLVFVQHGVQSTINPAARMEWDELVRIAHRHYHKMPVGMEPGLQAVFVWQVPNGGTLPQPDGTVNMYPCHSFDVHIILVEVLKDSGRVQFLRYVISHDCGTVINPLIVEGMTYGGVAHGIGAALYEHFQYGPDGTLRSATFNDYLMPRAPDVPPVTLVHHVTPSPWTTFGQKGAGEGGYMTAPAAIASAVEDAVSPGCATQCEIPMTAEQLYTSIHHLELTHHLEG
jgi:2-furoyl-CoA dehydrogenase large subunit